MQPVIVKPTFADCNNLAFVRNNAVSKRIHVSRNAACVLLNFQCTRWVTSGSAKQVVAFDICGFIDFSEASRSHDLRCYSSSFGPAQYMLEVGLLAITHVNAWPFRGKPRGTSGPRG